jgi:hypothetical protein
MAEITKTRTDLIERAATELGALTSGQNLEQEDSDAIDNLVDPLIQQLALDGVVNIQDTGAIESEFFISLSKLLANEAAPSFGQQTSADVKLANENTLRRLSATRPTYEVLQGTYY